MACCVLDASAALPWLFEDETSPASDALLERVTLEGAVVPPLWFLECANVLATAARRNRIDAAQVARNVSLLRRLPVEVDITDPADALSTTLELARAHRLTAYDAAYLDLAIRRSLPLATNDGPLRIAAAAVGVALLTVNP